TTPTSPTRSIDSSGICRKVVADRAFTCFPGKLSPFYPIPKRATPSPSHPNRRRRKRPMSIPTEQLLQEEVTERMAAGQPPNRLPFGFAKRNGVIAIASESGEELLVSKNAPLRAIL